MMERLRSTSVLQNLLPRVRIPDFAIRSCLKIFEGHCSDVDATLHKRHVPTGFLPVPVLAPISLIF